MPSRGAPVRSHRGERAVMPSHFAIREGPRLYSCPTSAAPARYRTGARCGGLLVIRSQSARSARSVRIWLGLFLISGVAYFLPSCILITGNFNPFEQIRQPLEEKTLEGKGPDKILILNISNVITGVEQQGSLGRVSRESSVARVKEVLRKAEKDDAIKGLLLRIDSPGGGVTASDIIYHELKRFKEKRGVPIVASFLDVAASGGYYVALSADEIIAHPTTVTGSIGVMMINLNIAGLFEKIGVDDTSVTSGKHKDIGSPFRKPTESDRQILQSIVNDLYARFLDRVREGRKDISKESLKSLTDGRILTAQQALDGGFIDSIGYFEDAITSMKKRAGLTEAKVVVYHRTGEYAENIYSLQAKAPHPAGPDYQSLLRIFGGSGPRFLYLWAPGIQ